MTPPRDPRHRRAFAAPTTARAAAAALEAGVEAMRAEHLEQGPPADEPPTGLLDLAAVRAALGADPGGEVNPAAAAWLAGEEVDEQLDDEEFCPTCFAGMESSEHHEKCIAEPEHVHPYFVEGCGECVQRAEQLERAEDDRRAAEVAPAFSSERSPEPADCEHGIDLVHYCVECDQPEPEPAPAPEQVPLSVLEGAPVDEAAAYAEGERRTALAVAQAAVDAAEAVPAVSSERSPAVGWVSRHDPRSRQFAVRRQFTGSVPVHDVLLPVPSVPLHQGSEDSCVGAAITQAENVLRLLAGRRADLTMAHASAAYRWAQRHDALPGENYAGTDVNAGMLAGRALGYWPSYSWSFGTRDIAQAVLRARPVVVGVPWLAGMHETGPGGLVQLAGADVGIGHALVIVGLRVTGPGGEPGAHFGWLNSRGLEYGADGVGWIHHGDLARLLRGGGEAAIPDGTP